MRYFGPQELSIELDRVDYRHPGVELRLFHHPFEGYNNVCLAIEFTVPNAYRHGEQQKQCVNIPVPPIVNSSHFHDWLRWRITTIALHEVNEMYWLDGEPMNDPHSETYWSGREIRL